MLIEKGLRHWYPADTSFRVGYSQNLLKVGRPVLEIVRDADLAGKVAEFGDAAPRFVATDSDGRLSHSGDNEFLAIDRLLDDFGESGLCVAECENGFHVAVLV